MIIKVNRRVRPAYPTWVEKVLHPELELSGPGTFESRDLELWLYPRQKTGVVMGEEIYKFLTQKNMLPGCLGLADLKAIQAGMDGFPAEWRGKALFVFGWKSVVRRGYGLLRVPYLYESGGEIRLGWGWLGCLWDAFDPALRFAK